MVISANFTARKVKRLNILKRAKIRIDDIALEYSLNPRYVYRLLGKKNVEPTYRGAKLLKFVDSLSKQHDEIVANN